MARSYTLYTRSGRLIPTHALFVSRRSKATVRLSEDGIESRQLLGAALTPFLLSLVIAVAIWLFADSRGTVRVGFEPPELHIPEASLGP